MQPRTLRIGLGALLGFAIFAIISMLWSHVVPHLYPRDWEDRETAFMILGIIGWSTTVVWTLMLAIASWFLARSLPRGRRAAKISAVVATTAVGLLVVGFVAPWILPNQYSGGSMLDFVYTTLRVAPILLGTAALIALAIALCAAAGELGRRIYASTRALAALLVIGVPVQLWNSFADHTERIGSPWGFRINRICVDLLLLVVVIVLRRYLLRVPRAVLGTAAIVLALLTYPPSAQAQPAIEATIADIDQLDEAGQLGKALARSERAVAQHSRAARVHVQHATLLMRANRMVDARAAIERALPLADDAEAFAVHGRILSWLGEEADARASLERALALDPDRVDAKEDLAYLTNLQTLRLPGGQPPPDSTPARVVDQLLSGAERAGLASAVVELVDPAVYERIASAVDKPGDAAELRAHVASTIVKTIEEGRHKLGTVIGYRILDAKEEGATAVVRVELGTSSQVSADDVAALRTRLATEAPAAVFDEILAKNYEQLDAADRAKFLDAFLGRKEHLLEALEVQLRSLDGRCWVITDVRMPPGSGLSRSLLQQIEMSARIQSGLYRAVASSIERHRPYQGWHPLDVATMILTGLVLGWLAWRLRPATASSDTR